MADILDWSFCQKDYLAKANRIDVKGEKYDLETIVARMKSALEAHKELVYVTANQVGYAKQVYMIRSDDDKYFAFANPIMARDGVVTISREHEYGVDNDYILLRWSKINLICYDVQQKIVGQKACEGDLAFVLQHVLNNLDGISIKDLGLEITSEFDAATDSERQEVIREYINGVKRYAEVLMNELKQDSETSKMIEAIEFEKAKDRGEVEIVKEEKKPNRRLRRLMQKAQGLFKKKK